MVENQYIYKYEHYRIPMELLRPGLRLRGETPFDLTKLSGKRATTWHWFAYGGVTMCRIMLDGFVITTGVAYCSLQDQYCKEIGRRISKGRALVNLRKMAVREKS